MAKSSKNLFETKSVEEKPKEVLQSATVSKLVLHDELTDRIAKMVCDEVPHQQEGTRVLAKAIGRLSALYKEKAKMKGLN